MSTDVVEKITLTGLRPAGIAFQTLVWVLVWLANLSHFGRCRIRMASRSWLAHALCVCVSPWDGQPQQLLGSREPVLASRHGAGDKSEEDSQRSLAVVAYNGLSSDMIGVGDLNTAKACDSVPGREVVAD